MQMQLTAVLTIRDYTLLEDSIHGSSEPFPGARSLILNKLAWASIVPLHELPADTVALKSKVRYRIKSAWPEERTIVSGPSEMVPGLTLLLTSPRAIALIGSRTGQTVQVSCPDGTTATIEILDVRNGNPQSRPRLTIVSSGEPPPAREFARHAHGWNDDDPGPSAA